ncbi:hypothetical protein EWM64_g9577 [Hericium alpestre]|uniref:Hemerythrin-like domain-containing protein n=1 Tax=Hericium alpestre TaxID=135208 RepID=A0A4Y9ZK86_9AGAM|nr:hypothetical protein EWM64_g9577 [Hericium alpestre]
MPRFASPGRILPLGDIHKNGGTVLLARLDEWDRELNYLNFRIAEWKEFGTCEEDAYYDLRDFLLSKILEHMRFELKTLSSILYGCERTVRSADVPRQHETTLRVFIETIAPGEITRRIHAEDWRRYVSERAAEYDDEAAMTSLFDRMRTEIRVLQQRSRDFRKMVGDLSDLVRHLREIAGQAPCEDRAADKEAAAKEWTPRKLIFKRGPVATPPISSSRTKLPPLPP